MKMESRISRCIVVCCMALWVGAVQADEWRASVGLFMLLEEGRDLQLSYRQQDSHYQFGYRYLHYKSVTKSPYGGNPIAQNITTMEGPLFNYLFTPEEESTFYVGVELLKWTRAEEALNVVVPSDTQSTTDIYWGGGYTDRYSQHVFFNLAWYFSPAARLTTRLVNGNSTVSTRNGDVQLHFGVAF